MDLEPASGEVDNSLEQLTGVRAAADDAVRILMKTSTHWLSRWWWVRKTNLRATEQSQKFHVRRGIHRSSVSRIIHKDLRLKLLQEKPRSTADWSAQHARVI